METRILYTRLQRESNTWKRPVKNETPSLVLVLHSSLGFTHGRKKRRRRRRRRRSELAYILGGCVLRERTSMLAAVGTLLSHLDRLPGHCDSRRPK